MKKNIVIILFAIISLLISVFHTPFWDETHAFDISLRPLSEIFYLTRVEGHPILWFLLLKPINFIKLFPYPMLVLNWVFCLFAIIILFKKSPFNFLQKTFLTLSPPFLIYFAPIARNYSIGILIIFLLAFLYEKRFKKPYLYAFLICLGANTSVMAMIILFYIGLSFLFELWFKLKEKKTFLYVFLMFFACALIVLLQFYNIETLDKIYLLSVPFSFLNAIFRLVFVLIILFLTYQNYKNKNYPACFIGFFSPITLYLFNFFVAQSGNYWHEFFYFIYLIFTLWISGKSVLNNKIIKTVFYIILILYFIPCAYLEQNRFTYIFDSTSKEIYKVVKNLNQKNSAFYTLQYWNNVSPGASTYLKKDGIKIYDCNNEDVLEFKHLKNIFKTEHINVDFDKFYSKIDKSKDNFVLIETTRKINFDLKEIKSSKSAKNDIIIKDKYILKLVDYYPKINLAVYKFDKIK